jgi:hypothetical protein
MSAADKPDTPTPDHSVPGTIPAPVSADLATDSNDPQELRRLLDRAVERLSFYESFDRTIGETLRRTGEMMEETVALREQAKQAAAEADAARSAAEETIRHERTRYRMLMEGALSEVRTARPVLDAMISRLEGALTDLSGDNGAEITDTADIVPTAAEAAESTGEPKFSDEHPAPDTTAEAMDIEVSGPEPEVPEPNEEPIAAPEEDEPEHPAADDVDPEATSEDGEDASEADTSPGVIDVIAHGVPSAATAIGLQQMLRELDTVSRVDAREFADGELRLQVECTAPFPEQPLAEWLSQNSGSLVSRNGTAIELSFT